MTCMFCPTGSARMVSPMTRKAPSDRGLPFDGEAEQRPKLRSQDIAEEGRAQPCPAVQAAGGDPAEIGADVAAIGEPRAVAEQEAADDGGEQRGGQDATGQRE